MSLQNVEKLEHNMAKLTIAVDAAKFRAAMQQSYNKQKGKISIPGFRKGKVPMVYLERTYGPEMFYEDAANSLIPEAYEEAAKESGLEITSQPDIDVIQIEKGKEFIFSAEVALKPEVTLGEYKGIEVEKQEIEVTDEEVSKELVNAQEQNSREITIEDRPVQDGDIVTIDYAGSIDGVAFEGGTAKGQNLVIGSHSFIDNFEEQLIGKNIGDKVDVNVTFPDEYHAADLAGKPALFEVEIHGIKVKELPVLDDDFAQDVSEFDTLDEYKADIKKSLTEKKEEEAKTVKENKVIDKIIENAQMDIPEAMIETQQQQMADEFSQRLAYQGLKLEQYLQFTGQTQEKFMEDLRPQAVKSIQTRLVLEAIADAENIEVSEEELNAEYEKMAKNYQMEVENIKKIFGDSQQASLKKDIAVQKAVDLVAEQAKEI